MQPLIFFYLQSINYAENQDVFPEFQDKIHMIRVLCPVKRGFLAQAYVMKSLVSRLDP